MEVRPSGRRMLILTEAFSLSDEVSSSINILSSTFLLFTKLGSEKLKNFFFMDKLTFVLQFWKVEQPFIFNFVVVSRSGQRSIIS